jgi:peptidoglycan/LPS O-acetylase OafA/YrhL
MKEIRALTGIRGIAALTVFLEHTWEALDGRGVHLPVSTLMHRLFLSAGRQVDIFFLLSGFILGLLYASWFESSIQPDAYFKFLRRRLARIYPLHLFMLLLVLTFVFSAYLTHARVLNGLDRFTLSSLPATLLLVHGWGFVGDKGGPWNPPSWSISIEALAYLLLPLLLWAAARPRKQHPALVPLIVAGCGFALNAFIPWGLAGLNGIVRGLSEFALGCTLIGLKDSPLAGWLRSGSGATVALAVLLVCYALTPDTGFVIAFCAAPLLLSLCGSNWVAAFMGWTPVYFLGEISYSIYLGHFVFTSVLYRIVSTAWMQSSPLATAAGIVVIVGLVVGLSTLTYYGIERPGRDWLSGRRKPALEQQLAA